MKKLAMSTTVVVVAEVPMKEQVEAQVLADIMIESVVAVAGGITVLHGSGVFPHALSADHKSPLLRPGLPKSPLSSPAKVKVGNICWNIVDETGLLCKYIQFTKDLKIYY